MPRRAASLRAGHALRAGGGLSASFVLHGEAEATASTGSIALSCSSEMLERLAQSFSTGLARPCRDAKQLAEVSVEAGDQSRLPGDERLDDFAASPLGAVVLDGALHLVGERLRRSLEPAPHVVDERGIELLFLLFSSCSSSSSWPGASVTSGSEPSLTRGFERLSLGLVLGEVGDLRRRPRRSRPSPRARSGSGWDCPARQSQGW